MGSVPGNFEAFRVFRRTLVFVVDEGINVQHVRCQIVCSGVKKLHAANSVVARWKFKAKTKIAFTT